MELLEDLPHADGEKGSEEIVDLVRQIEGCHAVNGAPSLGVSLLPEVFDRLRQVEWKERLPFDRRDSVRYVHEVAIWDRRRRPCGLPPITDRVPEPEVALVRGQPIGSRDRQVIG